MSLFIENFKALGRDYRLHASEFTGGIGSAATCMLATSEHCFTIKNIQHSSHKRQAVLLLISTSVPRRLGLACPSVPDMRPNSRRC